MDKYDEGLQALEEVLSNTTEQEFEAECIATEGNLGSTVESYLNRGEIKLDKLKQTLINISGENALSTNDKDINNLCKAVNYLKTQLRVQLRVVCDDEDYVEETVDNILDNTDYILNN